MPWGLIIALIVQFFGPIFADWLQRLFTPAAKKMSGAPEDVLPEAAEAAVAELFDHAIAEVPWYRFGKRRLMKVFKSIAVNRAGQFFEALERPGLAPVMNRHEAAAVAAVLAA